MFLEGKAVIWVSLCVFFGLNLVRYVIEEEIHRQQSFALKFRRFQGWILKDHS